MKKPYFWTAISLTAALHLSLLGGLGAATWWWTVADYRAPEMLVAYGDSDVEGLPLAAIAVEPGSIENGDRNTPGGEDQPQPLAQSPAMLREPMAELAPPAPTAPVPADDKPAISDAPPTGVSEPMSGDKANVAKGPETPGATKPQEMSGGSQLPPGTPTRGGKVGVSTGVRMPASFPKPVYPAQARALGQEGIPRVRVRVGADGTPLEVRLERSCGYPLLDESALRWARKLTFRPAYENGSPVEATLITGARFHLLDQ